MHESAGTATEHAQDWRNRIESGGDGLLSFFSLTFAIAWLFWWAAMAVPADSPVSSARALLFLPGTFAPAFVAIALTLRRSGRTGLTVLIGRIFRWKVPVRFYVFALAYVAAIRLIAAVTHRALVGAWPPMWEAPLYVMAVAVVFSTPFQAGEEIGWRGYALPRLAKRFGLATASVLLGVIWGAWHLPLFFAGGAGTPGESFPLFLVAATALSIAIAWLYWRTGGSLLLVMLMHSASNNTRGILASGPADAAQTFSFSAPTVGWLVMLLLWGGAVVLLIQMGRAEH